MPKFIYVLGDINCSPEYFNTRAEAEKVWRIREQPERLETVDAAKQCTSLQNEVDDLDDKVGKLTYWLVELLSSSDDGLWKTDVVKKALSALVVVDPSHIELPDLMRSWERINGRPHPDADKVRRM